MCTRRRPTQLWLPRIYSSDIQIHTIIKDSEHSVESVSTRDTPQDFFRPSSHVNVAYRGDNGSENASLLSGQTNSISSSKAANVSVVGLGVGQVSSLGESLVPSITAMSAATATTILPTVNRCLQSFLYSSCISRGIAFGTCA
jgi:hypothetical protein